ncbi:MAG: carboxyl transferase domain-containing protein [Alphaproteobacteria bacterium]|nr:carboxyl transferase domain-containing protein [Alphaproteobacteria bacterium]
MQRIESKIDTRSELFAANRVYHENLIAEFRERQIAARHSRPERDIERLRRQDKLLVRERLELLLDPGTPFWEFSTLAANDLYDGDSPGASVVTGIGLVSGREVVIHADDSSVKGGAWYPMSVQKIVRALDIAVENRLPAIHLCDSAGGFLEDMSGVFVPGGRVFRNQCMLSKLEVPQVAIVVGHCTAGGAYVPALCEHTIMVRGLGAIFLGGPPLVKAATGEEVTIEALGGADMHTTISGTADYAVDSEAQAIALARNIVREFRPRQKAVAQTCEPEAPYYDPAELYGILPADIKVQFDMREAIARMVDGSRFLEYGPDYGTTLVTGFAHIFGYKVGILGNNGVLFSDSSLKAAHFMQICNQNRVPLLFLQNTTGYMVGRQYEEQGITKDGAKMLMAQACGSVPKFTVQTNAAFGAGYYGMCGRAWDPRFVVSWPNSQMGVMGAEQAANTLATVKLAQMRRNGIEASDEDVAELHARVREKADREVSAYYSTSRLWDDGVVDPLDTRNVLGVAISAALNAPIDEPSYGVFRA